MWYFICFLLGMIAGAYCILVAGEIQKKKAKKKLEEALKDGAKNEDEKNEEE